MNERIDFDKVRFMIYRDFKPVLTFRQLKDYRIIDNPLRSMRSSNKATLIDPIIRTAKSVKKTEFFKICGQNQ